MLRKYPLIRLTVRLLAILIVLVLDLGACASADPAQNLPEGATYDRAEDIDTEVKIELYHEEDLPIGPGFSVYVSGWEPNDSIEVFAYDENKVRIDIVTGERRLLVSPEGRVSFSLPYNFHAFRPGRWLIVISGASGNHAHYVDIPQIE